MLRRAIADRGLLVPAFVGCLLATTLIASGPILATAVATAGVREELRSAAPTAANLRVTATLSDAPRRVRASGSEPAGGDLAELDDHARHAIARATRPVGATVKRQLRSGSFAVTAGRDDELLRFAWIDGVADDVEIVAGIWPASRGQGEGERQRAGGRGLQVAVPEPVAAALDWNVGDTPEITDARTGETQRLEIAAVFRVIDPHALPWWGEAPVPDADTQRGGFVIYGPLLVDRATMTDVVGATDAWWTAELAVSRLDAAHVDQLRRAVAGVAGRSGDDLGVDTGLADLLADTQQRLLASRAGALTIVLQLFLLAVYALALVARLVLAERVAETALLQSRGTRPRQLAGVAAAEALVLAVPAVVAGPPLASLLIGLLDNTGALAQAGLVLEPAVTPTAVVLAIVAGLITVVTLTLPTLTSIRPSRARRRQRRAGIAQQAGIDLALLGVAAIGYWQLRRAGSPVAVGIRGRLGLDPLLIAAPALSLLAGAVLTLRAVPALARVSERMAARGRRVVPALGAWQVARRPRTYARAALLPLLALALGLFALSYGRTWDTAQAAIAAQRVGADLLVSPGATAAVPPAQLSGTYGAIDSVSGVVPAWQDATPISRDAGAAEILAIDGTGAGRLAVSRDVAAVAAGMARDRSLTPAVTLPEEASQLDVRVNVTPLAGTRSIPVRLDLLLRDGHGLVHRLPTGEVVADGTASVQHVDLRGAAAPAAVVGAELQFDVHPNKLQHFRVAVQRVEAAGPTPVALDTADWVAEVFAGDRVEIVRQPRPGPDGAETSVEFNVEVPPSLGMGGSGDVDDQARVRLLAGEPALPGAVGVLVTERFAEALGVAAGDTVPVRTDTLAFTGHVERVVPTFPTLSGGAEATGVVMDLGTLAAISFAQERRVIEPTSWMLDTTGDAAAVAQRVAAPPLASDEVLDRSALAQELRSDPVALGVIGALSFGFATAAALAALGFVVAGVAAVRERITEFALLRAVGLSARQLVSWLTLEHGVLLAGALVGGVLLGGAMSWLILPYASLDATGASQPAVSVEIAWTDVLGLIGFLLVAVCASVLLLARPLRRLRLGTALRAGEAR